MGNMKNEVGNTNVVVIDWLDLYTVESATLDE